MKWYLGAVLVAVLVSGLYDPVRADERDAKAILDKAIKALGGEEKLGKVEAVIWKAKGTITFGGNDSEFTSRETQQGLDRYRSEFEGNFNGNKFQGVTVLDADKGWRKFGDMDMEMDKDSVANERRSLYLRVIPTTLVPLKGEGFRVQAVGSEKVGGKSAVGIKAMGPDGKDFKLYFDEESGMPVRLVSKVIGFGGDEFDQETTFGDYKDFDGIKKATRIETRRNGERFLEHEITEFKIVDKVGPETFAEPR